MVFALIVHSSTPVLNGVESTTGEKDGTVPPESVDVYFSYFYEKISGKDSDALAQAIATSAARSLWQQNEYNKPFQPRQGSTASRSNPTIASPSKYAPIFRLNNFSALKSAKNFPSYLCFLWTLGVAQDSQRRLRQMACSIYRQASFSMHQKSLFGDYRSSQCTPSCATPMKIAS